MPNYKLLPALAFVMLSGCVSVPHPGTSEGATPPRIVLRKDNVPVWTNVPSFGPIRAGDAEHAQSVCSSLDTAKLSFKPEGYHSKAEQLDGKVFDGGGYYCVGHKK